MYLKVVCSCTKVTNIVLDVKTMTHCLLKMHFKDSRGCSLDYDALRFNDAVLKFLEGVPCVVVLQGWGDDQSLMGTS